MHSLSLKILLIALLFLGGVGVAVFFITRPPEGSQPVAPVLYEGRKSPYSALMQTNEHYLKAGQLLAARDFKGAIDAYRLALQSAKDSDEEQQILFDIASATDRSGDPLSAIALYKQVITNESTIPLLRAYAIQGFGRMYRASRNPAITAEIFKDAPFDMMRVQGNDDLSYRNVFEYGSAIYPLALLELYIANSYLTEAGAEAASTDTIERAIGLARTKIANADKEIARMSLSPNNELQLVSEALNNKAIVTDKLSVVDPSVSASDVENAYIQTLNAYANAGAEYGNDFYARIAYAAFLAREYGASREADIAALLTPAMSQLGARTSNRTQFLVNSRTNPADHANVKRLGQANDAFRALLISLGWHEEDFAGER